MKTTEEIQKDAMRELAWKELIQAIKPGEISIINRTTSKINKTHKTTHHPAIVTSQEFGNWELFG